MFRKESKMPIFGVGPFYVISCLILTVLAIIYHEKGYFKSGHIEKGKMVFTIVAIFFIIFGLYLYIKSVMVQKIIREIKNENLITDGVYAIVRNPIYTAFLFVFTGVIIYLRNVFLLLLPLLYWGFLTVLLKKTEEKWLIKRFGKSYEDYCKKVNRVIPWFSKK